MPVDPSQAERALDAIRRQYGDVSVRRGSDKGTCSRIPTGDTMLDWATGGGIPMGRWSHFYGGYSSMKTLTVWNVIREAQKMGQTCAYYNAEKQFDPVWAEAWGIDLDALHVIEGSTIEGIGEKMETLLGSVHFHAVDSVAATVSEDELAGKVGDWNPGIGARAWGKALRRANERFDDVENTIILVNHVSEPFGRGGESPKGARFIEYMSSLSLHFRRSSWLFKDKNGVLQGEVKGIDTMTGDKEPDGMEFQVRVAKSRVGPPLRTARLRLEYGSGKFDPLWSLVRAAIHFGYAKKSGSWYEMPDGKKVQGENGVRNSLIENDELKQVVISKIQENV